MLQSIRDGDRIIVRLSGELDHFCAQSVRRDLDRLIADRGVRWLILDFSRMQFMDSSGIGLIMGRYRLMTTEGGNLTLHNASPRVERMIHLAGLSRLPIWNTTQERNDCCETHQ